MKRDPDLRPTSLLPTFLILLILGALVLFFFTSCVGPTVGVDPEAIAGLVQAVTDRHDSYVLGDPTLLPAEQETRLRSSELLRRIVAEAQRGGKVPNGGIPR